MKESMNVAKTVALNMLNNEEYYILKESFEKNKLQGIHIHCPEGAIPKDGPSAGAAIATTLYSLFTNKKIKNNYAITGELCLKGYITAIGSLELKILGGIKAGINHFIFPCENNKEFNEFYNKYKNNPIINNITFNKVTTFQEIIQLIIEK